MVGAQKPGADVVGLAASQVLCIAVAAAAVATGHVAAVELVQNDVHVAVRIRGRATLVHVVGRSVAGIPVDGRSANVDAVDVLLVKRRRGIGVLPLLLMLMLLLVLRLLMLLMLLAKVLSWRWLLLLLLL